MESFALLPKESVLHFPPAPDDYYYTPKVKKRSNSSTMSSHGDHIDDKTLIRTDSTDDPSNLIRHKTWPILQCDNVYILSGVPQYFAKKIQLLTKYFLTTRKYSHRMSPTESTTSEMRLKEVRKIVLNVEEKNIVNLLNSLVAKYSRDSKSLQYVKFGSYPFIDHPDFKTIITLESYNLNSLDDALTELIQLLPRRSVLRVEKIDLQLLAAESTRSCLLNQN